jgi:hemolysin activation/secretion protein
VKRILVTAAWLAVALEAAAQQAPDAGRLLDTVKPAPPPPQRPQFDLKVQPPPALKATDGLRVEVRAFRITGTTALPEAELAALLADLRGRTLTFAGLNEAAARLTRHYRANGYPLAQAYLPAQDIRDGMVEIRVLEGRIGDLKLQLKPGARLGGAAARSFLGGIAPGEIARERILERALLLLDDLPDTRAAARLAPGDQVGTADLVVEVSPDEGFVSGALEADNFGSRYTGTARAAATLAIGNPLGLGDQLTARVLGAEVGGLRSAQAGYALPLGSRGTRLALGYSALEYRLGKEFAGLRAHGTARATSLSLSHPLVRSVALNAYAGAALEHRRLEDRIDLSATVTQKKVDALRFSFAGNAWAGAGLTSGSLMLSSGRLALDPASLALDQAAAGRGTSGRFAKVNYALARTQGLSARWSLSAALSGQRASKNLDSSEKTGLGGPGAVRAYPSGEGYGDDADVLALEARYRIGQLAGAEAALRGFYDAGSVRINHHALPTDTANRQRLAGYGFAFDLIQARSFSGTAMVAWRDTRAATAEPDRRPRFWLQLTKYF